MKRIYLIAALLAMTLTASAQVKKTGETTGIGYVTPRLFSYGNKATIYGYEREGEGMDEKITFTIYNDDIEEVRSFEISGYMHEFRYEHQQRGEGQPEIVVSLEDRYEGDGPFSTWAEAKTWMEKNRTDYPYHSDYKFYPKREFFSFYHFDEALGYDDYKYPIIYYEWNPSDGYIYEVEVEYETIHHYTGEWETTRTYTSAMSSIENLQTLDYDDNSYPDYSTYLTQTLFNTDEKFEYIRYEYDDNATENSNEYDRDGDGVIDERTVKYGGVLTGFSIVQEDGTVLQTIRYNGSVNNVIKINGKLYLEGVFVEKGPDGNEREVEAYFRIAPTANGIKRMTAPVGMVVHPAIADRNQQVTVELDGDAREIQVVNAVGQTVKRIPVGEGQRQVNFNTRGLGSGVNVVRATGRNAEASRKFIVK